MKIKLHYSRFPVRKGVIQMIMKTFIFFMCTSVFCINTENSFSQEKVIIEKDQLATIEQVFKIVKKQTDLNFVFHKSQFKDLPKVQLKKGEILVSKLLQKSFSNSNISFVLAEDNTIVIKKEAEVVNSNSVQEKIQQIEVKGVVTDENGQPLPGASILEKGTTNGAQSDFDGKFTLNLANENSILVISYIGFKTSEIALNGKTNITVQLEEDAASLDEVVVTGYTSQSKRTITGSVVVVNQDELSKNPSTSVEQKLQGQVSGVNITASGKPGESVNVRIRGFGTTGDNNPLYVIDGVSAPIGVTLNEINPDDIESISVIKDASAASIYGARGSNGVILITTKRGRKGQAAEFTYSGFTSFDVNRNKQSLLNAQQWADIEFQGQAAAGLSPSHPSLGSGSTPNIPDYLNGDSSQPYNSETNRLIRSSNTDWFDEVNRAAFTQNHNINVIGGGENSRYGLSLGYLDREGTLINTGFKRYSSRFNGEFSAFNGKLRIGENASVAYSERLGVTNTTQSFAPDVTVYSPLIPVRDDGGNFAGTLNGILGLGTNFANPVARQIRLKNQKERTLLVFGNAYIAIDILPELTFKSNVGISYRQINNSKFSPKFPEGGDIGNSLIERSIWSSDLTWTNTLNFSKVFGNHSVDVLVGSESVESKNQFTNAQGQNFFNEDPSFTFISNASPSTIITTGVGSQRNLASLFGKIDYTFKSKYILNATVRRDGSSALGPNNRFDVFPAFGAGWIISDESFLEDNTFINSLKLKVGWGKAGNQNSLDDFAFTSRFAQVPSSTGYDLNASNSGFVTGTGLLSRGNPDLIWETSETINIGLDFRVLKNKLSGSLEWYKKTTNDLIVAAPTPFAAGVATPPFINIGEIENKGLDLSLRYFEDKGDLKYSISGVFSTYKNMVNDLDGNSRTFIDGKFGNPNIIASRTQAGHPISSFYGLIVDGVIQSGPNAGNFDFRDLDGNGVIDPNSDSDYIGSPHPDFTYSFNFNLEYKNFDFTAFFRGSQGNDIWSAKKTFTDFQFRSGINRSTRVLNAWRPDNPTNALAEYNLNTANYNLQASSYYVEDGSYLKLQTLQVGYTFQNTEKWAKKLRMYFQVQNVFTITNYSGGDPELLEDTASLDKGVDNGSSYGIPQSFLLGVNVKF